MLLSISLLAALATTDTVPEPERPRVAFAQAGVSYIVHHQPAIPLVALRLAILADDPPGYAGAGHLLQHLIFPTLQNQSALVGATVQMERTSDALVYTLTGPTAELEYLADVLTLALQPPTTSSVDLLTGRQALTEERLAEWETAEGHIRSALRARLFPNDLSAAGTVASAARLTPDVLPLVWGEMYRPERVSITAVGDVQLGQLQAAFDSIPPRLSVRPLLIRRDTISLAPLAAPQATRAWLGAGYLAADLEPATLSIVTRLLQDDLRRRIPTAEVVAEHWWTHYGQALVLVVSLPQAGLPSAEALRQLTAARRSLSTGLATLQTSLQSRQVVEAARAIRHDMLFYARTPQRMAEVLGSFADREGEAGAAQQFFADLETVGVEEVREALQTLSEGTPVRHEIPPQAVITTPRR